MSPGVSIAWGVWGANKGREKQVPPDTQPCAWPRDLLPLSSFANAKQKQIAEEDECLGGTGEAGGWHADVGVRFETIGFTTGANGKRRWKGSSSGCWSVSMFHSPNSGDVAYLFAQQLENPSNVAASSSVRKALTARHGFCSLPSGLQE